MKQLRCNEKKFRASVRTAFQKKAAGNLCALCWEPMQTVAMFISCRHAGFCASCAGQLQSTCLGFFVIAPGLLQFCV